MPKLNAPSVPRDINSLRKEFWEAPLESLLSREIVAAAIGYSVGWMELKATKGHKKGGISHLKLGRHCLYKKSDVIKWIEDNFKKVECD